MKRISRYLVVATVLATAGIAGTYVAHADWTVPASKVRVKLNAATMPQGVKPSVAEQSHTAVVSWSAQEIVAGVKMDRYVVTAYSQDRKPKPAIVKEVVATGKVSEWVVFEAAEISGGKWRWTVTPRFASWTGAESGLSKAVTFETAPAAVLVVAPTPRAAAPTTTVTTTRPAAPSPAAERTTSPPAPPPATEDVTAPPPAPSSADVEPVTTAPEPSASGPADEGIPK